MLKNSHSTATLLNQSNTTSCKMSIHSGDLEKKIIKTKSKSKSKVGTSS
jgi:hypothetical protein